MIASSAFVLAALTMTGIYMKENDVESRDNGYSVDFASLENSADKKFQEIARNDSAIGTDKEQMGLEQAEGANLEDDLDYMPMEVGSGLVEIPGLTEGMYTTGQTGTLEQVDADLMAAGNGERVSERGAAKAGEGTEQAGEAAEESMETSGNHVEVFEELHFAEEDGLVRPTAGEILMNYCMDGTVYFATLDQYKYNPAVIFSTEEGSGVSACGDGKVLKIYDDPKIGHAVTIDLGDGYQATYGQLNNIHVTVGSYVEAGENIASVAAPTKYFSVEGSNLYFQLTKDGEPVNPENLF